LADSPDSTESNGAPWTVDQSCHPKLKVSNFPKRITAIGVYIELFSGPGPSFIEDDRTFIDGSPLVAYGYAAKQEGERTLFELIASDSINSIPKNMPTRGH
jgi:hypothetical protein